MAIALIGALVVASGAAVVANRTPTSEVPEATEAVELHGERSGELLRSSEGAAPPPRGTGPAIGPDRPGTASDDPTTPTTPSRAQTAGTHDGSAAMLPTDPAARRQRGGAPAHGGTGTSAPGAAHAPSPGPSDGPTPSSTTLPAPFYLPGPGDAPVVGPMDPGDDDLDPEEVPQQETHADEVQNPAPPPHEQEPPDPDEAGCPDLDLYPIGGYAEGAPAAFRDLSPRFRALAPAEWSSPSLVCGSPLEPWRDLVVQRLVTGGVGDGALVTAADGSSPVMRLSEIEWTAYRFRYGGGPIGPNLLGYPVDRSTLGTVTLIRTTAGGLVFASASAMGVPVLGGAWDRWMQEGGPDGPMGLPSGIPEAATGATGAHTWTEGTPATGARQEFSRGWLFLPGVLSDVEAAAQPADRYEWHDHSEQEPVETIDYRGQIMQLSGISYYVDVEGVRHWIPTTSAWSCARWDLGATEYAVRGDELAAYPLGDEFVCDDFKD